MPATERKKVFKAGDGIAVLPSVTNQRTPPMADGTLHGATSNITILGANATAAVVNDKLPVVSSEAPDGLAHVGYKLRCTEGAWSPEVHTITYQWQKSGANIAGAVGKTYIPVTADIGAPPRCVVTATNNTGSTSATSAALANIAA